MSKSVPPAIPAQGMLTDHALLLLLDEDFVSLDLAHARGVTRDGVAAALRGLPLLRALDLSHAAFQPASLASLARTCPLLEVLRLGGLAPKPARAAAGALLRCLPRLQQTDVADSWEDLAEPSAAQARQPVCILLSYTLASVQRRTSDCRLQPRCALGYMLHKRILLGVCHGYASRGT